MDCRKNTIHLYGYKEVRTGIFSHFSAGAIALRNGFFVTTDYASRLLTGGTLVVRTWSDDAKYCEVCVISRSRGKNVCLLQLKSVQTIRQKNNNSTLEEISNALEEIRMFENSVIDIKPTTPGAILESGVNVYSFLHHSDLLFSYVHGSVAYPYNFEDSEATTVDISHWDHFERKDPRNEHCEDEATYRINLETKVFKQETNRTYEFKIPELSDTLVNPRLPLIQISGIVTNVEEDSGCPFFRQDNEEFIGILSFADPLKTYAFLTPVNLILSFLNKYGATKFEPNDEFEKLLLNSEKKHASRLLRSKKKPSQSNS